MRLGCILIILAASLMLASEVTYDMLIRKPEREAKAAERLVVDLGGKVTRDDKHGQLVIGVTFDRPDQVTDAALKGIRALKYLASLDLDDTKATDACLEELKGLKKFRKLALGRTKVTDAGVAALQKAIPDCEISR